MNQPMTSGATRTSPMTSGANRTTPVVSALAAVVWAVVSVIVTFLPNLDPQLNSEAGYTDAVGFLIGLILAAVALTGLQHLQEGRAGRPGWVGYWLIIVPFALLVIQTAAELIVGGEALGPLYPIGALLSRLGFILWGIAAYRARVLPRWLGPVLALAWIIAPPLGPIAAIFAIPASWAAAALAMWRPSRSAG